MNLKPGKGIMGSPGGQMVFPDLVKLDTNGVISASVTENDSCYVLRFDYADNATYNAEQRFKLLFIDKHSLLPMGLYDHLVSLGKRQVLTRQVQTL